MTAIPGEKQGGDVGRRDGARWGEIRRWVPDLTLAFVVAAAGLYEAATAFVWAGGRVSLVMVALGTAIAVGLTRVRPGAALAMVWAICLLQLLTGTEFMLVQLSVAVVAFGSARWGSVPTVWLSAMSIPLAVVAVVLMVGTSGLSGFTSLVELIGYGNLSRTILESGTTWRAVAAAAGMAALAAPWLAGLAFRFGDRARLSRASQAAAEEDAARAQLESEQAREIARLRDEQARLARDVHDVVGHSLAVILAQAESAQYLDDADAQRLKDTMATIARSARSSLQDVRQVLSETQQAAARTGDLDSLIDSLRTGGHELITTEVGTARPLPPELAEVAYRVLQEMLTNAIKHGRRDSPVSVELHWEGELRIEVRNVVDEPDASGARGGGGQGLDGMRRRLESVGGRLDVRRREEALGTTFTVTAWMPVRAGGR